jgi:hypothetical protein
MASQRSGCWRENRRIKIMNSCEVWKVTFLAEHLASAIQDLIPLTHFEASH